MKLTTTNKPIYMAATVAFAAFLLTSLTTEAVVHPGVKILEARFDSREVVKIEAGDFHFKPGQIAPIHTHSAPAIGIVTKGAILYQVEGEKPQLLTKGDAFHEPVGPRILRFDNASATEEAIFVDFNLQQEGEPFIVFPEPLKEVIDRRTLPTVEMTGQAIQQVNVHSIDLESLEKTVVASSLPTLGWVTAGAIEIHSNDSASQRVSAGQSFAISTPNSATLMNPSRELTASIVTFELH
ncbi:MAG: cupin domain-containing protein [Pseudomonadales bacterium]|nr:cupin domain-containing protein [Pseudomonadales bacterium]